jgi:hypothetical protein
MNDDDVTEIMGELRDMIVENYPGHSVCVDCESWHHSHGTDHTTSCRFGVGILPGLDGSKCSRLYFATIAEVREWIDSQTKQRHCVGDVAANSTRQSGASRLNTTGRKLMAKKKAQTPSNVPSKKRMRDIADRLWSRAVRDDWAWRCAVCGNQPCEAHHLVPRQHQGTRYDLTNGVALCAHCHQFSKDLPASERSRLDEVAQRKST